MVSLCVTRSHSHAFGTSRSGHFPHPYEFEAVVRQGEEGAVCCFCPIIHHFLSTIAIERPQAKSFLLAPPPPISKTAKERPAVEKPLPNPTLQARSSDQAVPFSNRTVQGISRSFKPPPLTIKSSNGSTQSSSAVSLLSTLTPDSASSRSNNTLKPSQQQQYHRRTPSQLSRELPPASTYIPHDRPLPLLPPQAKQQQQSLIHPAFRDTSPFAHNNSAPLLGVVSDDSPSVAENEANMKRLRNLMIKRKPLKGEDTAAEQGTSSLGYYGESVMLSTELLHGIWHVIAATATMKLVFV